MNIINEMALEFAEYEYNSSDNAKDFIDNLKSELYRYNKNPDKLNFIDTVREYIQSEKDEHLKTCKNKDSCYELKDYSKILYFLSSLSEDYGVKLDNSDIFSKEEKYNYDDKLDKILHDLSELKKGQELIYDDLDNEIQDLKKLYFLGKKNWKQLLAGKTIEMITGGMISESISKDLLKMTEIVTDKLLT